LAGRDIGEAQDAIVGADRERPPKLFECPFADGEGEFLLRRRQRLTSSAAETRSGLRQSGDLDSVFGHYGRHGQTRSRYPGADGMKRCVGLGVIADNLINISRALNRRPQS
jgi:hypothetical protein